MRPAGNPTQGYGGGGDMQRENPPSNNLWIGNVSQDVSEAELKALFEKYGKVDSVTTYSARNYAFVQFKEMEEARSAKLALQGFYFHGSSLKIEFAKPAKPCKSLWVAGISQSVSKEELENEFLNFGKIQEFRFLRDRNTAYVDYVALEDATQALKTMNGKRIGGAHIRVDYLRSQSSRRELGPDGKEGQFPGRNMWMGHDPMSNYSDPSFAGSKRKNQFLPTGSQYGDAPLSKVLWIRYPPAAVIEEDMLHNALILFGEIERIKTFSDKNYAFVEFRSVEEARRAKEGLQGKLFNDPRILIEYFNGEFPGGRGSEYVLQPGQMDILGLNHPALLGNNPGHPPSLGIRGPELYVRPPLGPHSTFEHPGHGPEFMDLAAGHKLQNPSPKPLMGGPSWNRLSPPSGIVSSPSAGFNVQNRSGSGTWDVFDANQFQRDSKRSRYETALPSERAELDEPYGLPVARTGGASGSLTRGMTGGPGHRYAENDCIWRGLIAKGGTPVCNARCVAVGEGLAADIPDVVNCSARTGLDLLSKHYEDATGFDIVFFLPDSEEDFASYTEFLRYLGSKDRAGVAKFDDGTTLFLVPPSDFLTKVLKVSGPERLYGVVLKFSQVAPSSAAPNPRLSHPQYADPHKLTVPHTGYAPNQPEKRPLDNSRVLPEDPNMPPKAPTPVTGSFPAHSVPPATVATQAGLALTPELIATLSSLLPPNNASPGLQTAPLLQTTSTLGATSHVASGHDNVANWKHEQQAVGQNSQLNSQLLQQLSSQFNPQLQHPQAAQTAHATNQFHQMYNPNSQMNDHPNNMSAQGAASSKPMAPAFSSQSGQDINQYYLQGGSQDALRSQGMDNGNNSQRLYNPSIIQQSAYPMASSNQHSGVPQPYMPLPSSEVEAAHQSQPPQAAPPFGATQESAETEADKNERYKTTLLFAANLLSRIHQPPGNQPGQGAGSH
ncbi:flowering time control protein FPA [Salvia miltiorrhiza]|uniref:flowering time control protein FPA n=1 Tax=Salvia miltiorrhiza TaxID=226208 RepID=UPI0025AC9FDF|nr:flowering time control protein FPA [Salvia miltiorrhiza]